MVVNGSVGGHEPGEASAMTDGKSADNRGVEDDESSRSTHPTDRGWAWMILLCKFYYYYYRIIIITIIIVVVVVVDVVVVVVVVVVTIKRE